MQSLKSAAVSPAWYLSVWEVSTNQWLTPKPAPFARSLACCPLSSFLHSHQVNKSRNPEALDVLLVHGFGASIGHFKKNIAELVAKGYNVHAIDLLGFGESEKPLDYR